VTALWSALGALGFSLVYWGAGSWIIEGLTNQAAVRTTAETYLPWAALLPVISVWGFLLDGVFIGATRTRELMTSMVVSFAVFVAASSALLALWQSRFVGRDAGLHGRARRDARAFFARRRTGHGRLAAASALRVSAR
jgi:Na+-driven multidrug efflux pump